MGSHFCDTLPGNQAFVKEFSAKNDALHWIDVLKALNNKNLLKGQIDVMKSAEASRKATQEAYEKIIAAKQVFVPEQDPAFVSKPSEGKDIWGDMFKKFEEPKKPDHPSATVRLPQVCLDKMKLLGFDAPTVGEMWGWQHPTLGWRVTTVYTHNGSSEYDFDDIPTGPHMLTRLGFIRCGGEPELTDDDKTKLRAIAVEHPALAIVISYPVPSFWFNMFWKFLLWSGGTIQSYSITFEPLGPNILCTNIVKVNHTAALFQGMAKFGGHVYKGIVHSSKVFRYSMYEKHMLFA